MAASTLLQIQSAVKAYGAKSLFEEASFAVNEGEHVGVIGPNGAGKTTLFKILVGDETLDSGKVIRSQNLRLGYLAQHDVFAPDETVESYLSSGLPTPLWELKSLGRKLGLDEARFASPIRSLSGGYRMRAKLLRLLGEQPNLMLLDEPTNYLDLETLLVLESFLLDYQGAFLLISHDREFLRRTTDHILEVEQGQMTKFPGSIDDYFEEKELLRAQLESRAMSLEAKRQEVLDFAARFGAKASKARQVQSRIKSLDRMETIELKALPVQAKVRIPPPARIGKLAIEAIGAQVGFRDRVILHDLSLQLGGGDHVGVVGLNGAGKTTLLRALSGDLPPLKGEVKRGYGIDVGYYGQLVPERLNPAQTVYEALMSVTDRDTTPQDVLDLAGSLLFSGDDVRKKISVLSGGEKSRVALGQVLLKKSSCLFLDEPTNHLDFYTVEALTQALEAYAGTVVVVSHDRGFIRRIATKILEVRDGQARLYPGAYDDYVWSLSRGVLSGDKKPVPAAPEVSVRIDVTVPSETRSANFKERRTQIDKRLRQLRKRVTELNGLIDGHHARMAVLNEELLQSKGPQAAKVVTDLALVQRQMDECETEWMSLADEDASLSSELVSMGVK